MGYGSTCERDLLLEIERVPGVNYFGRRIDSN
jgi:hypothetical protein